MNKSELNKIIKEKSENLGFNYIGFAAPDIQNNNYLDKWLDLKYHASMNWINTSKDKRKDIYKYFPEVKTIISFAYNIIQHQMIVIILNIKYLIIHGEMIIMML